MRHLAALACVLLAPSCALRSGVTKQAPAPIQHRPSGILIVLADDLNMKPFEEFAEFIDTPHLDALRDRGLWFTRSYVNSPMCPPARVTALCGLTESASGYFRDQPPLPVSLLHHSYPALLRQAGYWTGFVGKNGIPLDSQRHELLYDAWQVVDQQGGEEGAVVLSPEPLTAAALAHLARATTHDRWALTVWTHAPHSVAGSAEPAFVARDRFARRYATTLFPPLPSLAATHLEGISPAKQTVVGRRFFGTAESYQASLRSYAAAVSTLDDTVGQLVASLEAQDLLDSTSIIVASDNGMFLGEHGWGSKNLAHEPSSRVPLWIAGPGIATTKREDLVSNIDLAPTILGMAQVEPTLRMEGRDLLSSEAPPQALLIEHHNRTRNSPPYSALTTRRWKYIRYADEAFRELYDLEADPLELDNLALGPHSDQVASLDRQLSALDLQSRSAAFQNGFERADFHAWQATPARLQLVRPGLEGSARALKLDASNVGQQVVARVPEGAGLELGFSIKLSSDLRLAQRTRIADLGGGLAIALSAHDGITSVEVATGSQALHSAPVATGREINVRLRLTAGTWSLALNDHPTAAGSLAPGWEPPSELRLGLWEIPGEELSIQGSVLLDGVVILPTAR